MLVAVAAEQIMALAAVLVLEALAATVAAAMGVPIRIHYALPGQQTLAAAVEVAGQILLGHIIQEPLGALA